MSRVGYQGELDPSKMGTLADRLNGGKLIGPLDVLTADCLRLVEGRTLQDLHAIALRIDCVISMRAVELAKAFPLSALDQLIFSYPNKVRISSKINKTPAERAEAIRIERGDTNLWLNAGAEDASTNDETFSAQLTNIKRAEFFAVIALWKSVVLKRVVDATFRSLKKLGTAKNITWVPAENSDVGDLLSQRPDIASTFFMMEVAHLSTEISRAATLATEADYLDDRIRLASKQVAKDVETELLEVAKHRLREAGAKGAAVRIDKFKAPKARAIELYKAGSYRSRDAAVEDISQKLQKEKFKPVAVSTIRKYFANHDKQITQRREKSQKKS